MLAVMATSGRRRPLRAAGLGRRAQPRSGSGRFGLNLAQGAALHFRPPTSSRQGLAARMRPFRHFGREPETRCALRVVLVHDWLTGMRGGEKCLEPLCRRFPDARLLTLLHRPGSTSPAIERMAIEPSFLNRLPGVERHYRYLLPLMPRAIEQFEIPPQTDLVVSLSHAVAKAVRVPPGVPHVCYCFTPMRYAWDLRDDYFAAAKSQPLWKRPPAWVRDRMLDHLRRWDARTAARVGQFVAISQTIAERIERCYGRPSVVIYPPVDTEFYTPDHGDREDYYLCVSALVPYKRIDLAVEACRRLGRRLVVIGSGPAAAAWQHQAGPHVEWLGWQPNEVIRHRLRRCRALLFPGHEDFGIVPLEAQACGAPVIALARGGTGETVLAATEHWPGTGVLFEQPTAGALADAMDWFETHHEQCQPGLARRQAERFAIARFEGELFALLDQVVQGTGEIPLRRAA